MKHRYTGLPVDADGNFLFGVQQREGEVFNLRIIDGVGVYDSSVEHSELLEIRGVSEVPISAVPVRVPDMSWRRAELDEYAESLGIKAYSLSNKQAVLDAICEAE